MSGRITFMCLSIGLLSGSCVEQTPSSYLFTSLSPGETHVNFVNRIPEGPDMNSHVYEYFYNGGGVAIGDINNDGWPDLYFTSNIYGNELYLNRGDMKFENITDKAGVAGSKGWTTGATMVDINADGFLDIYVCKSGRFGSKKRENQLFINNGDRTFNDKAKFYGLNHSGYSTQAAFLDYDLDGDLDMFLLNHNIDKAQLNHIALAKRLPNEFSGDQLFENQNGKFVNVTTKSGIYSNIYGYGLGLSVGDLNGDLWPDIYVANDYMEHDYLYINQGNVLGEHKGFREVSKKSLSHMSNFSMGSDIADLNNDGLLDVLVLDMAAQDNYSIKTSMSGMDPDRFKFAVDNGFQHQYMYNTLQLNRGNELNLPYFSEIAQLSGLSSTDWSWAPLIADFNGDGQKDVFVTNGLKRDFRNNDYRNFKKQRVKEAHKNKENYKELMNELIEKTPQRLINNQLFINSGDLRFEGLLEDIENQQPTFSNGAAFADLDQDGDIDVVVNNIDATASILRNNSSAHKNFNYLTIKLIGPEHNPDGIGARLSVESEGLLQVQEQFPTRGYQSSVDHLLYFGTGQYQSLDKISIRWPDGKEEIKRGRESNQQIIFDYKNAESPKSKIEPGEQI